MARPGALVVPVYYVTLLCLLSFTNCRLLHSNASKRQSAPATKESPASPGKALGDRALQCEPPLVLNKAKKLCFCRPGKYMTTAGDCEDCKPGFYCLPAAGTNGVMQRCPENTLTRGPGAKSLNECINAPGYRMAKPKERGSNQGIARVVPCGPNEFSIGLDGSTSCTPCLAGFATDPENQVGTHTNPSVCVAPPGYFVLGNSVAPCPVGTFSPDYSSHTACLDCEEVFGPGTTTPDAAATSPDACIAQPGKVFVDDKHRVVMNGSLDLSSQTLQAVRDCPQGYYCPGGAADSTGVAVKCPHGMSTEGEGAASADECVAPPGWILPDSPGSAIQECPTGTYKTGWDRSTSCTPCGSGPWLSERTEALETLDPNSGQVLMMRYVRGSPLSCYIQQGMGAITARSSNSSTNTLLAVVCPEGFYGSAVKRYGRLANPCAACPTQMITAGADRATSYVGADGQDVPVPSGGFYSVQSCVAPAGYGYYGDQAQMCPQGSYNVGNNRLSCTACPMGTTTPGPQSTSIDNCTVYLPGWGLNTVSGKTDKCPIGTYSNGTGIVNQAPCLPCPNGRSSRDIGAESVDACDICAEGYGGVSVETCQPCPSGYYNPVFGRMGDSQRCLQCPVDRTWRYDWTGVDDIYVPTATGRPGGALLADCLADFSQTVDGAFYLDLQRGPEYTTVQKTTGQIITLEHCIESCRDDDACAAATFDYSSDSCSLWRPGSTTPGSTYATHGGIAMKTFTSAYIVSSVRGDSSRPPTAEDVHEDADQATADAMTAAVDTFADTGATAPNTAADGWVKAKHFAGDTQPGLFSYSVGSAAAQLSLRHDSLVSIAAVTSLTECLGSCVFDNLCSGVVFGAYDADSNTINDIVGAAAAVACQKIQATVQPGNSQRTLIKTRNIASLPTWP